MSQVDAILAGHTAAVTQSGPEMSEPIERYPRAPHAETIRELTHINGFRSTVAIATQWFFILGSLICAALFPYWWVFLIGAVVIATRLQAMGVLLHDAAHYSLYKSRAVNDIVADMTLGFPIGMSTALYRKTHFRHHRFTNSDQDQDLVAQQEEGEWYDWPKTRLGLAWVMVRSLFGVNAHKAWILYKYWAPWNNLFKPLDADFPLRARVLYVVSVAGIYALVGWGIAVNWQLALLLSAMYVIPAITLLNVLNRVRTTAEHVGTAQTHELNSTRTVLPTWMERLTIAPYNISFHVEHHLFPSVPGYNLGRLHRHLMEDEQFRSQAHITRSYVGFFRELMTLPRPTVAHPATSSPASLSSKSETLGE